MEVAGTAGAGDSLTIPDLTPGTGYTFTLVSVDNGGNPSLAPQSKITYTVFDHDPDPVSDLTATSDPSIVGKVTLSWTNPDNPDFDSVIVQYGLVGMIVMNNVSISPLFPGRTANFDVEGLTPNQDYFFIVISKDRNENLGEPVREEITILDPEVTMANAEPGDAHGEIDLSWVNPTNEDFAGVSITWSPSDGDPQPVRVAGDAGDTGSVTLSNFEPNTSYHFTLQAYNEGGNQSDGITVTSEARDRIAPSPVTALRAESRLDNGFEPGQIRISWVNPPDDDIIHVLITHDGADANAVTVIPPGNSFLFTLTPGQIYTFVVRVIDRNGNSSPNMTLQNILATEER